MNETEIDKAKNSQLKALAMPLRGAARWMEESGVKAMTDGEIIAKVLAEENW